MGDVEGCRLAVGQADLECEMFVENGLLLNLFKTQSAFFSRLGRTEKKKKTRPRNSIIICSFKRVPNFSNN